MDLRTSLTSHTWSFAASGHSPGPLAPTATMVSSWHWGCAEIAEAMPTPVNWNNKGSHSYVLVAHVFFFPAKNKIQYLQTMYTQPSVLSTYILHLGHLCHLLRCATFLSNRSFLLRSSLPSRWNSAQVIPSCHATLHYGLGEWPKYGTCHGPLVTSRAPMPCLGYAKIMGHVTVHGPRAFCPSIHGTFCEPYKFVLEYPRIKRVPNYHKVREIREQNSR